MGFGREAGRVRDLSLPARYRLHAWGVYRLLGQLHLVANGATPVATPWNFRA